MKKFKGTLLETVKRSSDRAVLWVAAFVLALSPLLIRGTPVSAAALSIRKDTLQTSNFGALSQQTFVFTTATNLTTDSSGTADFSFVVNFPTGGATNDPFGASLPTFVAGDFTASCTSCGSQVMGVTAVEASDNGGNASNDEFLIALNETGQDGNPLPAGSVVTLTFGASSGAQRLTNPTNDHGGCTAGGAGTADICEIGVSTSEAITGTSPAAVDNGDVLVALIEGVTVSVTVNESLSFSMDGQAGANCTGDTGTPTVRDLSADDTSVPFGSVSSPNAFFTGCQDLTVSTNASGGYVVTAEENTSLQSGSTEIPDTSCDSACTNTSGTAWGTNTNNGFGYTCEELVGTPCDDAGDSFTEYRRFACRGGAADCTPQNGQNAVNVMSDTAAANADEGRIHYKISLSGTQPAGTYSNTVTYIATPTF